MRESGPKGAHEGPPGGIQGPYSDERDSDEQDSKEVRCRGDARLGRDSWRYSDEVGVER